MPAQALVTAMPAQALLPYCTGPHYRTGPYRALYPMYTVQHPPAMYGVTGPGTVARGAQKPKGAKGPSRGPRRP